MTRDEIKESVEGEYVYASNNPSVRVKQVKFLLSECEKLEGQVKSWKDGPIRLTSLKYCEKHNALGLPTMINGNLACCLEQRIKELEDFITWGYPSDHFDLLVKVKELEEKLNTLQDHANGMGEIIHNQTKIRIGLEGELTVANGQVKQLEDERNGFRNGQIQLQDMVSDLMDVNAKWANRVKELEKGIKSVKAEKDWDAKEMELIELYKLIEKEKK